MHEYEQDLHLVMVTNPLEKVVVEEVDALLESVEAIRKEVSSDYHAELDEIKQNLVHYVNSDTAPWPELIVLRFRGV